MQVLLLDSDPESQRIFGQECSRADHGLTIASDFAEAADLLEARPFHLVAAALSAAPDAETQQAFLRRCDRRAAPLLVLADTGAELTSLCPLVRRLIADFEIKPLDADSLAARLDVIRQRRSSLDRERALLSAMPDMMFRLRRDGTFLDYHVPRRELLYAAPEEFLGRTAREALPPELAELTMQSLARALEEGSCTYEYELSLDGSPHQFEARLVQSGPDDFLAIVRDVTEQRRTMAALAKSEETMRALLEAMPDAMFRSTRDGVLLDFIPRHDKPIMPHLVDLVGKGKEEILSIATDIPRGLAERIHRAVIEALDSGDPRTLQYSLPGEGGQTLHEARLVPCGHDEVLGIVRDVTELKRAEEELRAAARDKQVFASRVLEVQETERQHLARELHDVIGQRLLVHRMDAEWMVKNSEGATAEAAEKLCGSLDETLALVRTLAQGLRPPSLDDLGVGCALQSLVASMSQRSSIETDCEVAEDSAHLPMPAALAVYRIAQEALANAVRHAQCRRLGLKLTRPNGEIELRVQDDGVGISPEMVASSRSLGLMGMRERAELLGGRVRIEAPLEGGTVVVAAIPQPSYLAEELDD